MADTPTGAPWDQPDPSPPSSPGPPLVPADEYCATDPPTGSDTLRALGVAFAMLLLDCGGAFGLFLAVGRPWGAVAIGLGLVTGGVVYLAAGQHRSALVGSMAAGSLLLAMLVAYALLWSPLVPRGVSLAVGWTDPLTLLLGGALAYALGAPMPWTRKTL